MTAARSICHLTRCNGTSACARRDCRALALRRAGVLFLSKHGVHAIARSPSSEVAMAELKILLRRERMIMNGTSVFRFSWLPWGKSPASAREAVVLVALLSGLFHHAPAFADGCPTPSFAGPVIFDAGAIPYSLAFGDFNG